MSFAFKKTEIPGLLVVEPHYYADKRGSNMKTFAREAFEAEALKCDFNETMIALNKEKNTIRGFHFQRPPYTQVKLCYCLSGAWNNYSIDLRVGSPSYGKVICIPMNASERKLLYIPEGIANAHLVLEENTCVLYQLGSKYMPEYDGGIRWDSVGVDFSVHDPIITDKDAALPSLADFESPFIYGENC